MEVGCVIVVMHGHVNIIDPRIPTMLGRRGGGAMATQLMEVFLDGGRWGRGLCALLAFVKWRSLYNG